MLVFEEVSEKFLKLLKKIIQCVTHCALLLINRCVMQLISMILEISMISKRIGAETIFLKRQFFRLSN